MSLFSSDLFRSFAVGFVLGAVVIGATFGLGPDRNSTNMVSSAVAAPAR